MNQRRIIAATDLTPSGERAVKKAALLAKEQDAELLVLHIVDQGVFRLGQDEVHRQQIKEYLKGEYPTATCDVLEGDPAEMLCKKAQESEAMLIVTGDHAPSAIKDIFVGTTAHKLVALAPCPVLVVKTDERVQGILVPTDFSESSLMCGRIVVDYWPQKRIDWLHVYPVPGEMNQRIYHMDADVVKEMNDKREEEAREAMGLFLQEVTPKGESHATISGAVSPGQEILRQIKEKKAGLVAMGTKGVGRLTALSTGSTADFILRSSSVDVLLYRHA